MICKEATLLVEVLNEAVKRYRQVIGNEEDNLKHDLEDGIVFFSPLPSPLSPLPSPPVAYLVLQSLQATADMQLHYFVVHSQ